MFPYIIAVLTLLGYWFMHAKDLGGMWSWINSNPKTVIAQVAAMFLVVTFRDILLPYMALPMVLSFVGSLFAGTLVDKLAKLWAWVVGLFQSKPAA